MKEQEKIFISKRRLTFRLYVLLFDQKHAHAIKYLLSTMDVIVPVFLSRTI